MLFSTHFSITSTQKDDWFDLILESDTAVFVDPFAIFKDVEPPWDQAYQDLIQYFEKCFELVAKSGANTSSLAYLRAVSLLSVSEPREFCLGYTARGTAGHGPGRARTIARAMSDAIKRGLADLRHFEELGILNEGIGPDGISDITCTVLKEHFIRYTEEVAERHRLPTEPYDVPAGAFDVNRMRWESLAANLPRNPDSGLPVILVPERFLRALPVLNANDWWDWYQAERLRADFNYEVLTGVDKPRIVREARANPDWVRRWIQEREDGDPDPYDFAKDPKGVWLWAPRTHAFVQANPTSLPQAQDLKSFYRLIDDVIARYRLYVEEKGGWRLLWNDDGTEKEEIAAQLVFRGIAEYDCAANNIVLDPEVNLGRGPVDFKFSRGYSQRAHLEVKKLHAGRFWNGLKDQLVSYMRSDQCDDGWLLAVQYRDGGVSVNRAKELPGVVRKTAKAESLRLRYGLVDGRPKLSASKLRSGSST